VTEPGATGFAMPRFSCGKAMRALPLHLMLAGLTLATLFPLLWMLSVSFMPAEEANRFPPPLLPASPTLAHYRTLFARLDIAGYALNSFLIASAVTVLSLLLNSMAGYAFAKLRFKGRDRLFRLLLAAMVIPSQVAMLPLFLMLKEMGLVNTYGGIVIPGMASLFGIFLIRQYALSIPDSLLDAARIDGAGEFRIYWRLVLPLCKPILVTLAIFTFMGAWNDFMWPLIILTDSDLYTLPVALANLLGEHVQDAELMMAGAVLAVLPVILLFLLLQKYYIEGLVLGGVKE
jgi:multiple sugar transport system permease protein